VRASINALRMTSVPPAFKEHKLIDHGMAQCIDPSVESVLYRTDEGARAGLGAVVAGARAASRQPSDELAGAGAVAV